MLQTVINPLPFWADFKKYQLNFLRRDLIAGLAVALMAFPQAMAYAFLADLPASTGIWSVVFGTIFTAAFGQSRFLVSGTTNTIAILIQSGISEILFTYYRGIEGVEKEIASTNIILQLVVIIGVFQIFVGLLRLGRLTQFTSRSVVVGYMSGAALAIVITQLFPFFGVQEMDGHYPLYQQGWYFLTHFNSLHWPTTLLAIGSLSLLILIYRISEKIPAAAIVFVLSALFVAVFKLDNVVLLKDIGSFTSDWPKIAPPFFEIRILGSLVPLAFAITLLSILEATAIGRNYSKSKDPPYNDNQEIYGLGISNFLSSFLGAMPSSGSFSRTALNFVSDAKTRFAAIFSGVFVFLFVMLFGSFVFQIPIAALSALMIFTAYTMVNFKDLFICLNATRTDAFVVFVTFISSLFFTLDMTFYIGIVVSIVLYLKRAAIPYLIEYTFNNYGKLRPMEEADERLDPRICIFQAEGDLFFGAADPLQTKLRQISDDESIKVIILQLLNTRYLDASACLALEKICKYLQATHRHFILTGISPEVWQVLEEASLLKLIGEQNCFAAKEQLPSEPTRNAYAYAKTLIVS